MAFELEAIVEDGDTISLSDREPFALLSARGMAGPPIRRITARGPAQHGDTDLGYRLQPREIELEIGFHATTDAILDGYRDILTNQFKPLTSTPVSLRVTRDEDIVRQIDGYTVGPIDISLIPEHRAAHYHRAVIRLRAPDPTYYDPVSGTASVEGTVDHGPTWYLAGGAIGTARVLMHGTVPAVSEAWSYTGTADDYTIAFRTSEPDPTDTPYAYMVEQGAGGETLYLAHTSAGDFHNFNSIGDFVASGTANYFVRNSTAGIYDGGGVGNFGQILRGTVQVINDLSSPAIAISGAARRWRKGFTSSPAWDTPIAKYALYSPNLTFDELAALDLFMSDAIIGGTINSATVVQLEGDMPDLPIIRITGPITRPSVMRIGSPSDLLAFGTATTIGAGTVVEIDTRHGHKTVVMNGSVNVRGSLEPYSDLGTWHLSPDEVQGNNIIYLAGQNIGTATKLEVIYHHRFSSY